jgi:hypothetical protein
MFDFDSRYYHSIRRNLSELERAISYRNAVNELYRISPTTCWSFFSHANLAMYDAMFFHIIKIFDEHKDAASFWYLWRCTPKIVEKLLLKHNITLDEVKHLSEKLITIRDKTHFHIDKSDVFNPNDVWDRANIIWNIFNKIIDNLWNVLNDLYREQFDLEFNGQIYTGYDIEEIIKSLKEKGITI